MMEKRENKRSEKRERKPRTCLFSLATNLFFLLSFLFLTACGFTPVYGTHNSDDNSPTATALNQVAIDNIPNREGQMLRNDLIDRMYGKGRPHNALYHLSIVLTEAPQDLGIQANATSTRSLLDTTANYSLTDAKGKNLLNGTAHSVTSYNKLSDQYASLIASEGASERTIKEVSEQIVNRLSLYFAEPVQAVPDKTVAPPTAPPSPANSQSTPTTSQIAPHY